MSDGTEHLVIGWTCDDCDEAIGDEPRMWDLAEQLRTEHEEETGHTTTVKVIEERRILPSQVDRMEIGESMLSLAEGRGDRIEWICPECQRTGEQLDTTKRCPDCDERLREVLPDGGTGVDGTDRGICISCSERKPVHVCHGDVWTCSACCSDENAGEGRCERSVDTDTEHTEVGD